MGRKKTRAISMGVETRNRAFANFSSSDSWDFKGLRARILGNRNFSPAQAPPAAPSAGGNAERGASLQPLLLPVSWLETSLLSYHVFVFSERKYRFITRALRPRLAREPGADAYPAIVNGALATIVQAHAGTYEDLRREETVNWTCCDWTKSSIVINPRDRR
jgi:hypothetical protein